jgi:transcriptional regulator with XRE-family HTH domain
MLRAANSEFAAKLVGHSIQGARTEVGITQAELAARMSVNVSYSTNIEAGRGNLTVGQLANIAEALGTGLDVRLPVLDREPIRLMPGRRTPRAGGRLNGGREAVEMKRRPPSVRGFGGTERGSRSTLAGQPGASSLFQPVLDVAREESQRSIGSAEPYAGDASRLRGVVDPRPRNAQAAGYFRRLEQISVQMSHGVLPVHP